MYGYTLYIYDFNKISTEILHEFLKSFGNAKNLFDLIIFEEDLLKREIRGPKPN